MRAAPHPLPEDGAGVIMQSYLGVCELPGCSDFIFVPGTNDCHVFLIRTEETLERHLAYDSVMDFQVEAKILMVQTLIARARKFAEGVCSLGGFQHFDGECAPMTAGECMVS